MKKEKKTQNKIYLERLHNFQMCILVEIEFMFAFNIIKKGFVLLGCHFMGGSDGEMDIHFVSFM